MSALTNVSSDVFKTDNFALVLLIGLALLCAAGVAFFYIGKLVHWMSMSNFGSSILILIGLGCGVAAAKYGYENALDTEQLGNTWTCVITAGLFCFGFLAFFFVAGLFGSAHGEMFETKEDTTAANVGIQRAQLNK